MLIVEEVKVLEKCPRCKANINDNDYFYRRKCCIMGYQCSDCGYLALFKRDQA